MAEDDEHDIVATKRAWKKHHGKEHPWAQGTTFIVMLPARHPRRGEVSHG
jgi:hypothetical protein